LLYNGVPEMSSVALLQPPKESILNEASVKAIFGEPFAAHGKTVAKIMYGTAQGKVQAVWANPLHGAKAGEHGLFP
jgi:hypothetical protein